jgi:mannose-1-phosphate guanylyltransferase
MKAVMLVGGEGTRLRPLTLDTPKPLMPLGNRPFLSHVTAHLARHGIDEAILTVGYLAEAFEGFPAEHTHGVKVTVVREDVLLDTGGAVKNVEHLLDDTFLVLNGDDLTDLDLTAMIAFHREKSSVATLFVAQVEDPTPYGLVPLSADGRIEQFIEKPRHDEIVTNLVNAGTYVLEPEALYDVPPSERVSIERVVFPGLLAKHAPMYGFQSNAYWTTIGTPAQYLRANRDVLEGKIGEPPPGRPTPSGAWVGEGARIDPSVRTRGPAAIGSRCRVDLGATIYPQTCLGSDCRIGERAVLEECVLHDEVTIGPGATVERSIIGRGVDVGARSRVVDAVIGRDAKIGADNELRAGIRIWPGLDIPDGSIRF